VSQHCRLCAGANQSLLSHYTRSSPSAHAPSLSFSDRLIMLVVDQRYCCVFLVNFRRWCVCAQFWDPVAPKREPSVTTRTHNTHAHNGKVRPFILAACWMLKIRSLLLKRYTAASSLDKIPSLLPSFPILLPRLPSLTPNPRGLLLQ
jgi:hypothetical protein